MLSQNQEVSLARDENGNLNLHLVMPATAVRFVNDSDEKNFFNEDDRARPGYNSTIPHFESDNENSLI